MVLDLLADEACEAACDWLPYTGVMLRCAEEGRCWAVIVNGMVMVCRCAPPFPYEGTITTRVPPPECVAPPTELL